MKVKYSKPKLIIRSIPPLLLLIFFFYYLHLMIPSKNPPSHLILFTISSLSILCLYDFQKKILFAFKNLPIIEINGTGVRYYSLTGETFFWKFENISKIYFLNHNRHWLWGHLTFQDYEVQLLHNIIEFSKIVIERKGDRYQRIEIEEKYIEGSLKDLIPKLLKISQIRSLSVKNLKSII